jgi:hypothetical protein
MHFYLWETIKMSIYHSDRRLRSGHRGHIRWWVAFVLPFILMIAACSGSSTTPKASSTVSPTPKGSVTTATTPDPNAPAITPIPGDFSVYVDPTWGYSFRYPSNWTVYPAIGASPPNNSTESNVIILEPYSVDPDHTMVLLMVRATNTLKAQFANALFCSGMKTSTTVKEYPAVDLISYGGSTTAGFTAVILGRAFKAKGLAFEIILQDSSKGAHGSKFIKGYTPLFEKIIASFEVGNGTTDNLSC